MVYFIFCVFQKVSHFSLTQRMIATRVYRASLTVFLLLGQNALHLLHQVGNILVSVHNCVNRQPKLQYDMSSMSSMWLCCAVRVLREGVTQYLLSDASKNQFLSG